MQVRPDAPSPMANFGEPLVGRTAAIIDFEVRRNHRDTRMRQHRFELISQTQANRQDFQGLAAKQGEGAVRRDRANVFRIIVIVAKLFGLGALFSFRHLGSDDSLLPKSRAQFCQQLRGLGKSFDENIARAVECGLHIGHAVFGRGLVVDVFRRFRLRIERRIAEQCIGQRLQAGLARDLRPRAPFGLVRQVNIFQLLLGRRRFDGAAQFIRELPLLLDRCQDHPAPFFQLAQIEQPLFEIAQLRVVEIAGNFLAVASDERHRGTFIEQRHRSGDLLRPGV